MVTSYPDGFDALASGVLIGYIIGCVIALVAVFLLAIIPSKIAKRKGYSGVGFYWFGVAALVPAIIVACVLRDKTVSAQNTVSPPPET